MVRYASTSPPRCSQSWYSESSAWLKARGEEYEGGKMSMAGVSTRLKSPCNMTCSPAAGAGILLRKRSKKSFCSPTECGACTVMRSILVLCTVSLTASALPFGCRYRISLGAVASPMLESGSCGMSPRDLSMNRAIPAPGPDCCGVAQIVWYGMRTSELPASHRLRRPSSALASHVPHMCPLLMRVFMSCMRAASSPRRPPWVLWKAKVVSHAYRLVGVSAMFPIAVALPRFIPPARAAASAAIVLRVRGDVYHWGFGASPLFISRGLRCVKCPSPSAMRHTWHRKRLRPLALLPGSQEAAFTCP